MDPEHWTNTNLLVLLPELLLLLVASFHIHLVHAQALEVWTVLVQKLREKTRDSSNRGKNICSFIKGYGALLKYAQALEVRSVLVQKLKEKREILQILEEEKTSIHLFIHKALRPTETCAEGDTQNYSVFTS
jgi:hypothetical protein